MSLALRASLLAALVLVPTACDRPPSQPVILTPDPAPARAGHLPSVQGPALRFATERHDFGPVSDTDILRATFEFENVGDERVLITAVQVSCQCMSSTLEKREFAPGEGDVLELIWHPKGRGRQTKTMTVLSNGLPRGLVQLAVSSEIRPFVRVEPMLVQFGDVRMGEAHRRRVTLTCDDEDFELISLSCSNPSVRVELVETLPGGVRVLEVTVLDTAPWGPVTGIVSVDVRGRLGPSAEPIEHTFQFTSHAQVFGELAVDKAMFAVGKVQPGGSFRFEARLTRDNEAPFEIVDLGLENSQPSGMSVCAEPLTDGANGYLLVLSGEAGAHLGYIRGQVRFATSVAGEPARRLAIAGNVAE